MKKLVMVLAATMMLAACSSGGSNRGTVALDLNNIEDFVAARVQNFSTGSASGDDIYVNAYFEGSNLVMFNNCVITCHYEMSRYSTVVSDSYTVKLTISGDGLVPSYVFRNRNEDVALLKITAVTGTVSYL